MRAFKCRPGQSAVWRSHVIATALCLLYGVHKLLFSTPPSHVTCRCKILTGTFANTQLLFEKQNQNRNQTVISNSTQVFIVLLVKRRPRNKRSKAKKRQNQLVAWTAGGQLINSAVTHSLVCLLSSCMNTQGDVSARRLEVTWARLHGLCKLPRVSQSQVELQKQLEIGALLGGELLQDPHGDTKQHLNLLILFYFFVKWKIVSWGLRSEGGTKLKNCPCVCLRMYV